MSPSGVPKFFALNSYSSFPFKPALLPLLHSKNPIPPNNARPAITAPTAIPAFAPVERPPPPLFGAADDDAERPVLAVPLALGVGALKSPLVTLKQGTWRLKSLVSTRVLSGSLSIAQWDCHVATHQHVQYRHKRRNSGCCHCFRPQTLPSTRAELLHSVQLVRCQADRLCSTGAPGRRRWCWGQLVCRSRLELLDLEISITWS